MTAHDLLTRLTALGVMIRLSDGHPVLIPPRGRRVRRELAALSGDLARLREELLELANCGLWMDGARSKQVSGELNQPTPSSTNWDRRWATQRMEEVDAAVERSGAPGSDPEIRAAVEQVCARYANRDRDGLVTWCGVIEGLVQRWSARGEL